MTLHRLTFRLCQTGTHVRFLQTSGYCQQQGAVIVASEPEPFPIFRTKENDPAFHTEKHIGQYYTIPPAHTRSMFPHGLARRFQKQLKTFDEACVMVRQPAVEVISYLKKTNFSKPALRYLFYGLRGSGKTMSLCHTAHFCYTQGWLVLHIPDAHSWVKDAKDLLPSTFNNSRFDQPLEATDWLQKFKITNEQFLSKIKLKHRYVWTVREFTEEGRPLGELVNQGLTRAKSSSDVVGAIMKELRLQCGQPETDLRLAVVVDGVNALWGRTILKKPDKSPVDPEELTLVYNLRKLMKNNWNGGAIIASLSHTGSLAKDKSSHLPVAVLGERGFDSMDPFVPVSVPNYSEKEFESCYLYYLDRHWLQHPHSRTEAGKKEIIFLSNRNPHTMEKICAFL